jgi:hypothetical protein
MADAKICSRAKWFGDFSRDVRKTKSTGAPTNSSASMGETGAIVAPLIKAEMISPK